MSLPLYMKMGSFLLFVLLNLFYVSSKATNPRSVNVALETSLLFQPGDENNLSFINKIRRFIDQIEQAVSPVKAYLRSNDENNKSKVFSKFMEKIILNIIKYDDKDLKAVAKAVANEAENILDTNAVFAEDTKKIILDVLKEYSGLDAKNIRYNLQNALNGNEIIITRLADKIDNYYDENDKDKLNNLIDKCDKFAKDKSDNIETEVKNMVKEFMNILKDKYDTLDETTKIQLNRDLGIILQYIDFSKIYINHDNNERNIPITHKNITKNENFKNKNDFANKNVEIFVNSYKNAKDGTDKVKEKNDSIENGFDIKTLDNQNVDLSTVLDELNKS